RRARHAPGALSRPRHLGNHRPGPRRPGLGRRPGPGRTGALAASAVPGRRRRAGRQPRRPARRRRPRPPRRHRPAGRAPPAPAPRARRRAIAPRPAPPLSPLGRRTGSVTLPAMALLTNLLTTAAATGIVVFVFQDGHLASLFGATAQPGIEQTSYLVLAAIVFGLSTDYSVFLLTRIKEARDAGLPASDAIAAGIQRTGAIVSAAAILLAAALGAFLTARVVFLKELGLGAAAAVLIDAFLVRSLRVPAAMRLLGTTPWWSPRPLRRLHQRLGISESQPSPQPAAPGSQAGRREQRPGLPAGPRPARPSSEAIVGPLPANTQHSEDSRP